MKVYIQIKDFLDYFINRDGEIISLKHDPRVIKPFKDTNGYFRVSLSQNGVSKQLSVHRLVAQAFVPNPNNFPQINHENYIKTDNRVENLTWCTTRQNCTHKCERMKKTSKYVGVSWDATNMKWRSSIQVKGKIINLGRFKTEDEARHSYVDRLSQEADMKEAIEESLTQYV